MTKRRKRVSKSGAVWHQTSEEATLARKPYINGYACGHGVHGDVRYNRAKEKRSWRKQVRREGASYGPFSFCRTSWKPEFSGERVAETPAPMRLSARVHTQFRST